MHELVDVKAPWSDTESYPRVPGAPELKMNGHNAWLVLIRVLLSTFLQALAALSFKTLFALQFCMSRMYS